MRTPLPSVRRRPAFTLIELLVVISIIAVLVGLLLPAVQKVRESAARTKCQNNLHNMGVAVHNYHTTFAKLPPGAEASVPPRPIPNPDTVTANVNGTSWMVYILPQMEQQPLYDKYQFYHHYNDATFTTNATVSTLMPATYMCQSARVVTDPNTVSGISMFAAHYVGVMGPGSPNGTNPYTGTGYSYTVNGVGGNGAYSLLGMLPQFTPGLPGVIKLEDVLDGTSNTIMIGELSWTVPPGGAVYGRSWTRGNSGGSGSTKNITNPLNSGIGYNGSNNFNDIALGSNHIGGCNFALGDGSVRFIAATIDMATYMAASTIAGREPLQLPN